MVISRGMGLIGLALLAVSAGVLAWAAVIDDAADSDAFPASSDPVVFHNWQSATFVERHRSNLTVRLEAEDVVATVNLRDVATFDCRTNCWHDVRDGLAPLTAQDRICIYSEARRGPLKLWINRWSCAGGGPVVEPTPR